MSNLYIEKVSEDSIDPYKATSHAACYDVHASIKNRSVMISGEKVEVGDSSKPALAIGPNFNLFSAYHYRPVFY